MCTVRSWSCCCGDSRARRPARRWAALWGFPVPESPGWTATEMAQGIATGDWVPWWQLTYTGTSGIPRDPRDRGHQRPLG